MAHRIRRCATLALALATAWPFASSAAGGGNLAPAVTALSVSPTPIPANGPAVIRCSAADDAAVTAMSVTVSGGTLPSGGATESVAISAGASVAGALAWTTPAPGTYQVTCTATDGAAASTSRTLAVVVVAAPPVVIDSLTGPIGPVKVNSTVRFSAAARDASGGAVTYTWAASRGTLVANGADADWTAPATGGAAIVGVTASNAAGQSASLSIQPEVAVTLSQGRLGASVRAPRRLAVAPGGRLYVAGARGNLAMLTPRGDLMGNASLPDRAVAVAASDAEVFASLADGRILKVDPDSGKVAGDLGVQLGRGPVGMALDQQTGLLWVAERDADRVRALRQSGTTAFELTSAGSARLRQPTDVALDPAGQLVWVLLEGADSGQLAHAFSTVDGSWVRSALGVGSNAGQAHRGGGLAVDAAGRVYASDFLNGTVQVLERSGASSGKLGLYGSQPGQLRQPGGAVVLASGDLVVANGDNGRLERFGENADLPACPGDRDCDGMPDDWEVRNGLNPDDASDALADADGDGLTNKQEYKLGTDPLSADTDGDGIPDGIDPEPLVGAATKVVLAASAPASQGPGLVRISSVVQNGTGCTAAWTQVGGPEVKLRKATSLSPSFVARQSGAYKIQGVATCGGASSQPALVETTILNVAPRADAGRLQVVRSGSHLELDGSFSSDANGDALSLAWEQVLGQAAAASKHRGALRLEGRGGLLGFELTASDGAGLAGQAEVPVLVLGRSGFAPVAAVESPVVGKVGAQVVLDARESILGGRSAGFEWVQLAGPAVELREKHGARPSFAPPVAGHYAFAASVVKRGLRSPPARVDVYVASGAALPRAVARVVGTPALGEPLTLDGAASQAASGGALAFRWRQVAGPAAGLTEADQAVATVVPFAPGHYAFELGALEGADESRPSRVAFMVVGKGGGAPLAVARASTGKDEGRGRDHQEWGAGRTVRLDGSSSKNAIRWRWTQVGGPWVALDGGGAVATFVPQRPGTYAFELEVDDGSARSAPATVTVTVPGDCHERDHHDDDDDDDRDDDREEK